MTLLHRLASVLRWIFRRDSAPSSAWTTSCRPSSRCRPRRRCATAVAPAEARRLAMLELGGVEQAKEHVRTYRHGALARRSRTRRALRLPHVRQESRLHRHRRR